MEDADEGAAATEGREAGGRKPLEMELTDSSVAITSMEEENIIIFATEIFVIKDGFSDCVDGWICICIVGF